MEKSLVSVIIPSHGGGQYLERAVDSVLSQTYPNIEIIVVDDNGIGTPNQLSTQQIMQKYYLIKLCLELFLFRGQYYLIYNFLQLLEYQ